MANPKNNGNMNQLVWKDRLRTVRTVWRWVYRLRSIFLALPVFITSVVMAIYNLVKLPEIVSVNLGDFAQSITRGVAVMGPFALTIACLFLMFISKRVLYPWLISVFSLVLPFLFLFSSAFPG